MPKHVRVRSAQDEQEARHVHKLAQSHPAPADWVSHARMIIESWAGHTPDQIAATLHCHPQTVRVHVARFNAEARRGVGDETSLGAQATLDRAGT